MPALLEERQTQVTSLAARLLTFCLLAIACSGSPDDPPICNDDEIWIVNKPCVEVCPRAPYATGSCEWPVTECVRVYRGDVFAVVRPSDTPEPTEAELGVRECADE